jgi:ubiquitin carboxyl-terminal hydrolase 25
VKPTQDLAELTLFSTATEANFRRASISSPSGMPNLEDGEEKPVFGPHLPPPPPPEYAPPPVPKNLATVATHLQSDVEMTDEPSQDTLDNDDSSSQATLVNPESKKNGAPSANMSNVIDVQKDLLERLHSAAPPTVGNVSVEAPLATVSTSEKAQTGNDEIMANSASLTPPPETLQTIEKRPPVPPRNKPAPIKTSRESEENLRAQKLYFGAQQDVTEVIGNVIFRLQCAIKPTSFDPKFGEQIDVIRETFFGANAVHLKKADSYDVKVEDWANIIVFPGLDGQRDIYEALDVVFDEQIVEIDNANATQFASINSLPPIVQIQIQRTAFDPATQQASKNQNRIVFDETIYLDRYMEDEKVLQRRRDAWMWKNRIRLLESRKKSLGMTNVNVPVTGALHATKDFIQTLDDEAVNDISINPDLAGVLEQRAAEVSNEFTAISKEISSLKAKLQEQFTDLRQHRYRLQAVFIHRGTNAYGHYWIYIYDFARDIWREYNDERVTIVEDSTRIFGQSGTGGATPYYLVYVRDEDKDDIVDAVCREITEQSPTRAEDMARPWNNGQVDDEAIDVSNGTQHIENYEPFEANNSSNMDLSGMGAWEGMQSGFNGKK